MARSTISRDSLRASSREVGTKPNDEDLPGIDASRRLNSIDVIGENSENSRLSNFISNFKGYVTTSLNGGGNDVYFIEEEAGVRQNYLVIARRSQFPTVGISAIKKTP